MENELQSLNERIAERVGKELVDLIPPEQWQSIVDGEVQKFKTNVLPVIVQDLLKELYMDKIKGVVNNLSMQTGWDSELNQAIYENLEKFIATSSGIIVAGMLSPATQTLLQDLRNRLGYS